MSNFKIATILSATALILVAEGAIAGEMKAQDTADNNAVSVTQTANTRVLSASTEGLIAVRDADGNLYYNQIVPVEDLQDVELDAEVLDTFTYVYEGRVYTNKIVK